MGLSKSSWGLVAALALNIVLAVLLSPLGFEDRPQARLTTIGVVAIAGVLLGVVLDVVAIVVLVRGRIRMGANLAIAGSLAFAFPNIVDRLGLFFSLPIPPVVNVLEYAFMGLLVVTLVAAARTRASAPRREGRVGVA